MTGQRRLLDRLATSLAATGIVRSASLRRAVALYRGLDEGGTCISSARNHEEYMNRHRVVSSGAVEKLAASAERTMVETPPSAPISTS